MEQSPQRSQVVVIGYQTGTGKHVGLTSHLMCEYRGRMFRVPCDSPDVCRVPPRIGTRVLVEYSGTPDGLPVNPTVVKLVGKN